MILKKQLEEKEKGCKYSLHRVSRFIQPSVLLFLLNKPSYGYELIEKLKELGFHKESLDIGAIYRTLRKLEKEGYVKSYWRKSQHQRKKRFYKITPEGKILLKMWAERIEERKRALEKFIEIYAELMKNEKK